MLKAGVHFGHQRSRWHPKMEQYLFGVRNGVHVIDLDKTVEELEKSLRYVKTLASEGKVILFVGTKRQAREPVRLAAESCGMPYLVERWIGGLLTNFEEFRRRLKKYKGLKEMVATGEVEKYTKKEQSTMKKQIAKLDKYLIGLTNLEKIPDALYIADLRIEKTALAEATKTNVTMVAVCDSNVDPTKVKYPIPANDDAVNSVKMIVGLLAQAINEGKAEFEKRKVEMKNVEIKNKEARLSGGSLPTGQAGASGGKVEPASDLTAEKKSVAEKPVKKERRALRKEETV